MIAQMRINIIVVDLHIVYIDTVMYIKLQFDKPISTAAETAEIKGLLRLKYALAYHIEL